MTVKEFVIWASGYYGPYPLGQRDDVAEYLSGLTAPELDELRLQMRATCPSHINQVNGYPPDIQAMEKLLPEARRQLRIRAADQLSAELAARLLPAPDDSTVTEGEMMEMDWGRILAKAATGR